MLRISCLVIFLVLIPFQASAAVIDDEFIHELTQRIRLNQIESDDRLLAKLSHGFINTKASREKSLIFLAKSLYFLSSDPTKTRELLKSAESSVSNKDSLVQIIRFLTAQSYCASNVLANCIDNLQLLLVENPTGEWRVRIVSALISALFKAERYQEIPKIFSSVASQYFAYPRDDNTGKIVALSMERIGLIRPHLEILEKMARNYPISDSSRWAFRKLLGFECEKNNKFSYYFSTEILVDISRNAKFDDGIRDMLANLVRGKLRIKNDEIRYLDPMERTEILDRMRFHRESAAEKIILYEDLKYSDQDLNALLLDIARTYLRGFEPELALNWAKKFFLYGNSQENLDNATELFADIFKYLGMADMASAQYQVAMKINNNPVLKWDYFWNTYRNREFDSAKKFLAQSGKQAARIGDDADLIKYWIGKSAHHAKNFKVSSHNFDHIMRSFGDSFYANIIAANSQNINQLIVEDKNSSSITKSKDYLRLHAKQLVDKIQTDLIDDNSDSADLIDLLTDGFSRFKKNRYATYKRAIQDEIPDFNDLPRLSELTAVDYSALVQKHTIVQKNSPRNFHKFLDFLSEKSQEWKQFYPLAYKKIVYLIASSLELDPLLVLSVMRTESLYDPQARSAVGAMGLMQIMPYTAIKIANLIGDYDFKVVDLTNPLVSIIYGSFYLEKLIRYYQGNLYLAVAAYNAGPVAVNFWINSCKSCSVDEFIDFIPYRETRSYVKKVVRSYANYRRIYLDKASLDPLPKIPESLSKDDVIF